jgi:ABC-type multidrug transport system fused ATPase/permease subunit
MPQIQFGTALRILMQTLPMLGIRLAASLLFWLALIVYVLIAWGIAAIVGNLSETIGVILFLIALIAIIPLYNLAYEYVFYVLKAAHLAIIAELLVNGTIPDGMGQLEWGRKQVEQRFGQVSIMFVMDGLVNGVIRAFTNTLNWITAWIPGDSVRTLVGMVNTVIRFATMYIDEAVLARAFWLRSESVWNTAIDGIVLYAMAWKPLLMNAVALMVLSYIPFIVVFILFTAPVGFLLNIFSSDLAAWAIIVTLVLAYLVKVAVGDSFAMIAIIATYQKETANLTPDPAMKAKLEGLSSQFRDLQQRAGEELARLGGRAVPTTPAQQPPSL